MQINEKDYKLKTKFFPIIFQLKSIYFLKMKTLIVAFAKKIIDKYDNH